MSTDDISDYFNQNNFKIKKIFWLNDYSCIIEFDDESIALEAYQKFTGFNLNNDHSENENYDWKPSLPFKIQDDLQELSIRICEKDVN